MMRLSIWTEAVKIVMRIFQTKDVKFGLDTTGRLTGDFSRLSTLDKQNLGRCQDF